MSEQAYYNEIEPFAGDWLENLIASKQITAGKVDRRSITDVQPADVAGFQRCHFFAGIAGWDLALSLAGWDGPVWTASCPCQPFSSAGKQKGTQDERHLWPVQFGLVDAVRPPIVFGEQVSSAIGHGWLDGVFADLEGAGYTCGAAVLGAHSVGAPHIRQRLYWFGCRLEFANSHGREAWRSTAETNRYGSPINSAGSRIRDSASDQQQLHWKSVPVGIGEVSIGRSSSGLGECVDSRLERHRRSVGEHAAKRREAEERHGSASGAWSDYTIGQFRDGKSRRIGCGVLTLVNGLPAGMGRIEPGLFGILEDEVVNYAKNSQANPTEVMRDLWDYIDSKTIQRRPGRLLSIHSPEVLLSFLLQLAEQGREVGNQDESGRPKIDWGKLRVLWIKHESACSPCERGLVRQPSGEYPNSLRELSSLMALAASRSWSSAFVENAAVISPLTNSLPGNRTSKDETQLRRRASGNRKGRLKGYGNAIVPQDAAIFIRAVMDWMEEAT